MENYLKNNTFKKGMLRKHLTVLFLFIFALSFVSAYQEELGIGKQDDCIQLIQTCTTCPFVTMDSIILPNKTVVDINTNMTKTGNTFNYTFCRTDVVGDYIYNTYYGNFTAPVSFGITYTGDEITVQTGVFYSIALLVLAFIFFIVLGLIDKLPSSDTRDDRGAILQIVQLKHLRKVLWAFEWLLILAIVFISANMGLAYLPNLMVGKFLFMIFKIMGVFSIIGVPVWFILILVNVFRDKEMKQLIDRGVDIGGYS